jgi:tRNA-dihydrouridine synthase A
MHSALISPLAIAPMIDWTYMQFRVLMRLLAPQALLYTEMQTTGAIEHNPVRALQKHASESPVALQLGGSELSALVRAAQLAQDHGFAEVNLNLGCPSDRVQAGRFGACLMAEPDHVAACIEAIKRAVDIPVTAKTRIGIDNNDSYAFFSTFAQRLIHAGCDKLIVHARKAWLHGLSPKQNRTIPPLHYDYVYQIKKDCQECPVVINGNIQTVDETRQHLQQVDGVMIGRLACQNPYQIAKIHHAVYPDVDIPSRAQVITRYVDFLLSGSLQSGLSAAIKPMLNLAHGLPGAKQWRERLVCIQHSGRLNDLSQCIDVLKYMEC